MALVEDCVLYIVMHWELWFIIIEVGWLVGWLVGLLVDSCVRSSDG